MTAKEETDQHKAKGSPSKWGKGKTDPATWWTSGCPSPNPQGRPKKSKNQKTMYMEAMEQKVTITQKGGKKKTLTKQEMAYHQLANKAASGDMKAIAKQMELDQQFDPPDC